jgi:hypothetical protein
MKLRFKKSINLGGLRINLSNGGVGYSVGGKGFRVGVDAQGKSYVAGGIDVTHGTQILLDNAKLAASENVVPFEIYKIENQDSSSMLLRRFDYTADWDGKFCPELSSPWGFCDDLRNGDIMFYPNLSPSQQNQLLTEAIKMRTEFSFQKVQRAEFNSAWDSAYEDNLEAMRTDWVYEVGWLVDTPPWIDQAWRDYVKGIRPFMPKYGSQ